MVSPEQASSAPLTAVQPAPNRGERVGVVLAWCHGMGLVLLGLCYLTVGDTTALGEYLTVWPPVLWVGLFGILGLPFLRLRRKRHRAVPVVAVLLFCGFCLEWRPMLRGGMVARPVGGIRVVSWNIGGGYPDKKALLAEIGRWKPDLVLLQETGDGEGSLLPEDLVGEWAGFQWVDTGDCGVLSRWPLGVLPTAPVGPWDKPTLVSVGVPGRDPLLLANVRLMLPSLILLPLDGGSRDRMVSDNHARVGQFVRLRGLLEETRRGGVYSAMIVGGDFNTDASAVSLRGLGPGLADVWPRAGRGWGRTITAAFSVGRIDQVWGSRELRPVAAWVPTPPMSDHHPVVVDLAWGD